VVAAGQRPGGVSVGAVCRAVIDALRYNRHMTDGQATVARFDQWAPWYNDSALQAMLYRAVHALVLNRCVQAVPSPRRLLDVGCGTGRLRRSAAARFAGTGLVGVDVSGGMLTVAAVTLALVPSRVLLVQAAAERLPFADALFDLVTATLTYRHWADRAAGVAEVGRVLTPGGVFGLAALLTPPCGSPRRWPRRAGSARLPAPLVAALTGAGLRPDRVEEVTGFGPVPEVTFVLARRVPGQ
jgi:ubiquinone/menaquinone biosynthesis C-methylase UbiE